MRLEKTLLNKRRARRLGTRRRVVSALIAASFVIGASAAACTAGGGAGKDPKTSEAATEQVLVLGPAIDVTDPRVGVMGRVVRGPSGLEVGYPGVTVRTCFTGPTLSVVGSSNNGRSRFAVVHDGAVVGEFTLPQSSQELSVWRAPAARDSTQVTCVDLVHQTETWIGIAGLASLRVAGDLVASTPFAERKLLFIGDSVTCGEAVSRKPTCSKDESWWNAHESYGALAARKLDAQHQLVCYGGRGVVRDWQGRTDTLNAPQFFTLAIPDERQLPAALTDYVPNAVVVSLGTNDFNLALGAFPNRERFVSAYVGLVRAIKAAYPQSSVFLTEGAMVVNDQDSRAKAVLREYVQAVVSALSDPSVVYLAATHHAGDVCDSHPTAVQHVEMAADVADAIAKHLNW